MHRLQNLNVPLKVLIGVLSWGFFVALFIPLYPKILDAIFVFQIIPVVMWAMLYGRPGGIAAGITVFFINFLLVKLPGADVLNVFLTRRGLLALFFVILGAIIGRLVELNDVVNKEIKDKEKAQDLYKKLLDTVPETIILYKPEGVVEFASGNSKELFGLKDEKVLFGEKALTHVAEESKKEIQAIWQDLVNDVKDLDGGVYLLQKEDGTKFWGEISASRIKDDEGKVVNIIATIRNVNEKKTNEDEFRKRSDELERLTKLMIGRENKMLELKKQLAELQK
jgi:PAS domain S-box-containing protein